MNSYKVSEDPEVAHALSILADKLRERGKNDLAHKLENLVELLLEELEAEYRKKL